MVSCSRDPRRTASLRESSTFSATSVALYYVIVTPHFIMRASTHGKPICAKISDVVVVENKNHPLSQMIQKKKPAEIQKLFKELTGKLREMGVPEADIVAARPSMEDGVPVVFDVSSAVTAAEGTSTDDDDHVHDGQADSASELWQRVQNLAIFGRQSFNVMIMVMTLTQRQS